MIVLLLLWPVYLICLLLVLQHLFPASSPMIRLGACLGGIGMRVSCWIGFLSGPVSMQCGDAISVKACSSMEPCQPTMESERYPECSRTKPLSPYRKIGIFTVRFNCLYQGGSVKR